MERKYACVDTEEGVPTQHFYIPILEVQGIMRGHGRGVGGNLVV